MIPKCLLYLCSTLLLFKLNYLSLLPFCLIIVFNSDAQEIEEQVIERTRYSKVILNNDGVKERIISLQAMNYQLDNEWNPIELTFELETDKFTNRKNVIQSSFPTLLESYSKIDLLYNGNAISIGGLKELITYSELSGAQVIDIPFNASVKAISLDGSITYEDVYIDINDKYTLLNGGVKNELILKNIPFFLANGFDEYFGFREKFVLPTGWSLEPVVAHNSELIESAIAILDENNNHVLTIPEPVFYDKKGLSNDGRSMIQGAFLIDKRTEGWILSTILPTNWLNDPSTSYPVVLDPTVVLSGANGGWQSQNNYVNNPNYMCMGVCCGNLEHRAWVQFNTTSINDVSCVTNVELEVYVNEVGGAASQLVHAYDMTGAFGPYADITPAVYADMGNGYYTSFFVSGVGTYGYYNLGPNAVSLLQTQLVTMNAFQVALIFDNELSTNWKRLTESLCNLRVTYNDPPCLILPFGLINFDVQCVSNQANLSWSTISENNSNYFTIWKSTDNENFVEIAKIKASGSSNSRVDYRWVDTKTEDEFTYFKLTQTDKNDSTEEFDTKIFVPCENNNPFVFSDEMSRIHIRMKSINHVIIRDNLGRTIASQDSNGDPNEIIINHHSLKPGLYSLTANYGQGNQRTVNYFIGR